MKKMQTVKWVAYLMCVLYAGIMAGFSADKFNKGTLSQSELILYAVGSIILSCLALIDMIGNTEESRIAKSARMAMEEVLKNHHKEAVENNA